MARSKTKPLLALTDVQDVLAARDFTPLPVVFVVPKTIHTTTSDNGEHLHTNASRELSLEQSPPNQPCQAATCLASDKLIEFSLGGQRVAIREAFQKDQHAVQESWQATIGSFDLREPFGRIREAIEESQGGSR